MTLSQFKEILDAMGFAVEAVGVLVIVLGAMLATVRFLRKCLLDAEASYRRYRLDLGKAILLGLEFMVAGDIIRTVLVDPTVTNVAVLGLIVLIRTFLSIVMQLEVDGRWPWQQRVEVPPLASGAEATNV